MKPSRRTPRIARRHGGFLESHRLWKNPRVFGKRLNRGFLPTIFTDFTVLRNVFLEGFVDFVKITNIKFIFFVLKKGVFS